MQMRANSKQNVRNSAQNAGRNAGRNAGLDLLRAIAIVFVLVYHLPFGDAVQGLGLFGVEIFLTLSGFLVATMIFERFGGIQTTAELQSFLTNRWLRTLPLYYLALTATVIVTAWLGIGPQPDISLFLVFLQNLTHGGQAAHGNWFGASWSLALEEWFYVLLPVTLWLARGRPAARTIVLLTIALLIVSLGGRSVRYLTAATFDFDDMYRRTVIFRLDTFCWGMLMYLAVSRWEQAVTRYRLALFGSGIALIALSMITAAHAAYGQAFQAVAMLTTLSMGTALLIPFFRSFAISGSAARAAYFLSTRTYALYLTHGLVYAIVAHYFTVESPIAVALMLTASLATADAVYRFIERPILNLRNADTARPFVNVSAALTRLHTRLAFEVFLIMGSTAVPVYAPALIDRRKISRF
jgi:peptidoglycan/LPS O-acetylase OafA/YrhL